LGVAAKRRIEVTQSVLTREQLVKEYERTHPRSLALHQKAIRSFGADGATHVARVMDPFRPYVTHALGSKKWDVDGHEYIDFVMGHGALILGHGHPKIVKACQEQIAKGVHYGENHELELRWAELIQHMMPVAERIEFCASGQEANMMAIRLARVATGRKKVLRFVENFHGWFDEVTLNTAGAVAPEVDLIPMNDLGILEKALATKEYALVFVEGGGAHMAGQVPWDRSFIRALPALTKKYGTLFHLDEVVTGFRESRGGWQEVVDVKPDLSTLGKCVGGGLGVGAVIGRADLFDALSSKAPAGTRITHSGTWNANPLTSAAGVAACELYLKGEPQNKAVEMGTYLREAGNKILRDKKVSGLLYGRTVIHTYFGPLEVEPGNEYTPPAGDVATIIGGKEIGALKTLLGLHLLHRGVATMGGRFFVMSAAHSREDVNRAMEAFADSLDSMIAEGVLPKSA
jgi:glutamate-1-semialdehyde 2,1-aminomutase